MAYKSSEIVCIGVCCIFAPDYTPHAQKITKLLMSSVKQGTHDAIPADEESRKAPKLQTRELHS